MVARTLASLSGTALLVVAVIAGWVDMGATGDLLSGRRVTVTTALALVTMVCWMCVAAVAGGVIGAMWRRRSGRARPRLTALVASAVLVLGLGIAHRATAGYRVCCMTPDSASVAEQHVR